MMGVTVARVIETNYWAQIKEVLTVRYGSNDMT